MQEYRWNRQADPTTSTNSYSKQKALELSGLPLATIPRPSEAPALWDMPYWNPLKAPCTSADLQPSHAKGLNVVYADAHVKFHSFDNNLTSGCWEDWWSEHNWEGYFE